MGTYTALKPFVRKLPTGANVQIARGKVVHIEFREEAERRLKSGEVTRGAVKLPTEVNPDTDKGQRIILRAELQALSKEVGLGYGAVADQVRQLTSPDEKTGRPKRSMEHAILCIRAKHGMLKTDIEHMTLASFELGIPVEEAASKIAEFIKANPKLSYGQAATLLRFGKSLEDILDGSAKPAGAEPTKTAKQLKPKMRVMVAAEDGKFTPAKVVKLKKDNTVVVQFENSEDVKIVDAAKIAVPSED